jgi:hypothetical protein
MTTQTSRQGPVWGRKPKALAAGLLTAAMMAACMMTASSARAATTFTVNSTADTPDASTASDACDTNVLTTGDQCTLRAAIEQTNATAGADTINFAIPGTGVKTISPGSPLPPLTEQVTIDGYTQPGASPNTKAVGSDAALKIVLNGTNVSGPGFEIPGFSSNNLIKGLVINRFTGAAGIAIHGTSVGNRIEGNFIGTDVTGTLDRGNDGDGVSVSEGSDEVVIGGTTPASRNVISGNDERGVEIRNATFTRVLGNRIGTTASGGSALGNGLAGVAISGSGHVLGDSFAGGSNSIAFNGGDGVSISSGTNNIIDGNSIFSNAGLGIDLADDGATANDPGDADVGPNNLQNKPVLTAAKTVSGKTTIEGRLSSRPDSAYTIQLYSNPSGTNEGKKFIGEIAPVHTNASGEVTFTFSPATKVPVGQTITATARAINLDASNGDTSEFSAPKKVAFS